MRTKIKNKRQTKQNISCQHAKAQVKENIQIQN